MMLCASFMTAIGEAAVSFEHEWHPQVQWCGPLSTPEGRKRWEPPPAENCRCVLWVPTEDEYCDGGAQSMLKDGVAVFDHPKTPERFWTDSEVELFAKSMGLLPYREVFDYEEENKDAT